ncbi:MAG: FtsX-like permease family protein [Prochloraceae cyanobacterium]|nr:FtsX-like permease family protein [Prochloraceae cyanobacterium]
MNSLDRKLFRDLLRQWGQLIAIALVVSCGIASFVMSLSAYDSLKFTKTTYYNQYRFAEVFASLKRAPETLSDRITEIPGVGQVQTRIVVDVILDVPEKEQPATGRMISLPSQQHPMLNDIYIRRGRYIEAGRGDEVLVSESFAKANNLKLEDTLGAVINGRWQKLRIVGIAISPEYIYEVRGGASLFPDNERFGILWMEREALATAFDMDGAFNNVTLTLSRGASEQNVIDRLDRILERYGGLGAYPREDQLSNHIVDGEIKELEGMTTVIPTLFLAIAAFLLHVVLSRLIATQREQIAILKAFGYTKAAIGFHYLKFVMAIVLFGATLGTILGLWMGKGLTELYAEFLRFPIFRYNADWRVVFGAIAISIFGAIVGGLGSVYKAVSLPPAVAMRPEPPPEFKPTLIERWGLQNLFSPAGRIILRNLERKPLQASLSILGIALAVAILITGRYFEDAVTYLVDVQFRHVQREDVTIVFNEPRPARTRYEVAKLPGVVQSEVFRSVPAKLRFQHYQHRSGLTGIQANAELLRLVDRSLNTVNLPADGVVLTKKLAEILHVQPGDVLTVEVLEADRPVRSIPVVGLVDELMGLSAYMEINALNKLMREGQTISGAYLRVDANLANKLYTRLKEIPAVAAFTTRQAALDSFNEISGKNMRVMTFILVIFASIITFSVVYNSARIALSERSRELASLRILGFTRAEIAFILLGEQAILILLAIPIGFLLGYGFAAYMSWTYNQELFRLPLIITRSAYAFTFLVVSIASVISGFIIRRQLNNLDLIAVLKTRE